MIRSPLHVIARIISPALISCCGRSTIMSAASSYSAAETQLLSCFYFCCLKSLIVLLLLCAQTVKDRALIKTKRFAKISDHNFCCFVVIMSMTHHHHLHLVRNAITTKTTIASTRAQCTPIMCKLLSMVLCVRWKPQFRGQAPGTHAS